MSYVVIWYPWGYQIPVTPALCILRPVAKSGPEVGVVLVTDPEIGASVWQSLIVIIKNSIIITHVTVTQSKNCTTLELTCLLQRSFCSWSGFAASACNACIMVICTPARADCLTTCSHLNRTNFQVVPPLNRKMAHTFQMCLPAYVGNSEKCVGNIPANITAKCKYAGINGRIFLHV